MNSELKLILFFMQICAFVFVCVLFACALFACVFMRSDFDTPSKTGFDVSPQKNEGSDKPCTMIKNTTSRTRFLVVWSIKHYTTNAHMISLILIRKQLGLLCSDCIYFCLFSGNQECCVSSQTWSEENKFKNMLDTKNIQRIECYLGDRYGSILQHDSLCTPITCTYSFKWRWTADLFLATTGIQIFNIIIIIILKILLGLNWRLSL